MKVNEHTDCLVSSTVSCSILFYFKSSFFIYETVLKQRSNRLLRLGLDIILKVKIPVQYQYNTSTLKVMQIFFGFGGISAETVAASSGSSHVASH